MTNALMEIADAEPSKAAPREIGRAEMTRVLHLITSFEVGGTERQAVELLKRIDRRRFDARLAAVRLEGPLYGEVEELFPRGPQVPVTRFYNANAARQLMRLRHWVVSGRG